MTVVYVVGSSLLFDDRPVEMDMFRRNSSRISTLFILLLAHARVRFGRRAPGIGFALLSVLLQNPAGIAELHERDDSGLRAVSRLADRTVGPTSRHLWAGGKRPEHSSTC